MREFANQKARQDESNGPVYLSEGGELCGSTNYSNANCALR